MDEKKFDLNMNNHWRPDVGAPFERCASPTCGWTSDYPAMVGAQQEPGNSFYNYHYYERLHRSQEAKVKITAIEAGCAECNNYNEPLIVVKEFQSIEEAEAHYAKERWLYGGPKNEVLWEPHPQGGKHVVVSQGSVWLRPEGDGK